MTKKIIARFKNGDIIGDLTIIKYNGHMASSKNCSVKHHQYLTKCKCGAKRMVSQEFLIDKRIKHMCIECSRGRIMTNKRLEQNKFAENMELVKKYWKPIKG